MNDQDFKQCDYCGNNFKKELPAGKIKPTDEVFIYCPVCGSSYRINHQINRYD